MKARTICCRLSNCSYHCCYRCQPSSSLCCPQDALFSSLLLCSVPISDASLCTLSPEHSSPLEHGSQLREGGTVPRGSAGNVWRHSLCHHWVMATGTERSLNILGYTGHVPPIEIARSDQPVCPSCWGWETLRSTWEFAPGVVTWGFWYVLGKKGRIKPGGLA